MWTAALTLCVFLPADAGQTLSGVVNDSDGRPLSGATVFIWTAGPREGVGILCPGCYPDCGKIAATDSKGNFSLEELDSELTFQLLAIADGHKPAFSEGRFDPREGAVTFTLSPHDFATRDPALILRGRVLDADGNPLAGAAVEPFGDRLAGPSKFKGTSFGAMSKRGFDPLALTDGEGRFRLAVPKKDVEVALKVSAPRMAARNVWAPAGEDGNDLTLYTGVEVTGRVVKDGKPLAGVAVGVAQKDRDSETFVGDFRASTDETGTFHIPNVPQDQVCFFYGLTDSFCGHGAVAARELRTGEDGTTVDLGPVAVAPGLTLAGRVVLSDGKALPEGTRVILSRVNAWAASEIDEADDEGRFRFEWLPAEEYQLSVNVTGYHVSPKNPSYGLLSRGRYLTGTVEGNISGLELLMEPGQAPDRPKPLSKEIFEEYRKRKRSPLAGVEADQYPH